MVELRSAAAAGGHSVIAAALLDKGADINVKDKDGETALHPCCRRACRCGGSPTDRGVDVQVRNQLGDTPFMVAALQGIAKWEALLSRGMQQRLLC